MTGQEGTVFVLTNDAMPGYARLEFTTKDDIATRVQRINKSEVPIPYKVHYAAKVANCDLVNRNLHFVFSDHCEGRSAQFFRINPDLLRAAIELAATSTLHLTDEDLGISPAKRAEMDKIRQSHESLRFGALTAASGTTLFFSKDRAISCTSLGNGKVQYEGMTVTPAEASMKAMQDIGFDWEDVASTEYWEWQEAGKADETVRPAASQPGNDTHAKASAAERLHETIVESPVMLIRNQSK